MKIRCQEHYDKVVEYAKSIGVPGDKKNGGNYTKVDWWNPWLMVWD